MSGSTPGRLWGFWSEYKLQLLAEYLAAFTTATKRRARERVYLDLFAGEGRGVSSVTGQAFEGSARIALNVEDPPFTQLRFCELGHNARLLEQELRADYPDRQFRIVEGDCNDTIPHILAELRSAGLEWAPTFAFVDPDGMELRWDRVRALADYKRHRRFKTELWVLFSSSGLMRVLQKDITRLTNAEEQKATQVYGSERWAAIQILRHNDDITPAQAREEFVNLYRWQLERDLGYKWTHALEVKNLRGVPLYHMVFATDNETGNKIMTDRYNKAVNQVPVMRREAKDRISGQFALFEDTTSTSLEPYHYQPPWEPPS